MVAIARRPVSLKQPMPLAAREKEKCYQQLRLLGGVIRIVDENHRRRRPFDDFRQSPRQAYSLVHRCTKRRCFACSVFEIIPRKKTPFIFLYF